MAWVIVLRLQAMFNRSRHDLARWFTLSMGSILIVFAGIIYYLALEDQLESLDRLLYKKTRMMAASVQPNTAADQPPITLSYVPFLGSYAQPLETDLVYVRWYDAQQQLVHFFGPPPPERLDTSPGFHTLSVTDPASGTATLLRQVTLPVHEGNVLLGYLQVATPMTATQINLQQFQLLLTLALPVGFSLVGIIGWWLSGIAMKPIQDAYNQLQRFTADASHELRSPLSAILNNAQVGLLMTDDPQNRYRLDNIIESARSMSTLVNHLLLLARHQGKLPAATLKWVALNDVLENVAVYYAAQAALQQIKLTYELPHQIIHIWADPDLLRQAIANLLSNACKYTPAGGTVQLRLNIHPPLAVMQVQDTGIGIPATDLPYVFDRFYRVDTQRTRETGGFGLGLAIAQRIIQAHGGRIGVTSTVGEGCNFQVEIPLKPDISAHF